MVLPGRLPWMVAGRELLVSLVDRIELTQDKQLIIHFRIPELQDFSL